MRTCGPWSGPPTRRSTNLPATPAPSTATPRTSPARQVGLDRLPLLPWSGRVSNPNRASTPGRRSTTTSADRASPAAGVTRRRRTTTSPSAAGWRWWRLGRPGRAAACFADYAAWATQHVGDLLTWVCTLNEPNLMAMMRSMGGAGHGSRRSPAATGTDRIGVRRRGGFDLSRYRMGIVAADVEHMATAHRLAVQAVKRGAGPVKAGRTPPAPTSNRATTARSAGARCGGWPRRTSSPSPPTTTSSACSASRTADRP